MRPAPDSQLHPGLLLEKWHDPWPARPQPPPPLAKGAGRAESERRKQEEEEYKREKRAFDEFARRQLERVTKAAGDASLLGACRERFGAAVRRLAARSWRLKTAGPLTLHLSRAGSFENAGLALHPLYGFAYLPGTGIKGMARFYARNIARASASDIEAVFGKDTSKEEAGAAGLVIFYDAWPVSWPRLIVDIVNNHHREYYEDTAPPEDWEEPNPVNFLAVAPGAEFEFFLGLRKPCAEGERLLGLAQGWIEGAVAWLGAGAKTNAGYGRFRKTVTLPAESQRAVFNASLTLVSPAFLAGAMQGRGDCDLRPAALRGLLRWWWRTLHAGYLTVAELRELEGKLWGLASQEGAISIALESLGPLNIQQFQVQRAKGQLAPGRAYLAYGMEGNPKQGTPARYFIAPGGRWKLTVVARQVEEWDAATVLDQAICALWLLSRYGGVGAKCRRGFGSLEVQAEELPANLKDCVSRAQAIRPELRFDEQRLRSPSVHRMRCEPVVLGGNDHWQALDRLGEVYRSFTMAHAHDPAKAYLGLPRRPLDHPKGGKYQRHASPLHFRLLRTPQGYAARITAFYSPNLPDLRRSKQYLEKCISHIKEQLKPRS